MKTKLFAVVTSVVLLTALVAYTQLETPTVANMPPVVVSTVPQSGDTNIDPGLTEIRVTFSKD